MLKPIAVLLAFASVTLAISGASAATDDDLRKAIVGTWGNTTACNDEELTFRADGTFTSHTADSPTDANGTYQINGGHLTGTIGSTPMPDVALLYDGTNIAMQQDDGTKNPMNACPPMTAAPSALAPTAPAQ